MLKLFFPFSLSVLLLGAVQTYAQTDKNLSLYKEHLPYFQEVISGGQYKETPLNYEGNPYFKFRTFENGSLTINGITYTKVPLLYDQYSDILLTFQPIYNQKILINSEKIEEFVINNEVLFRRFDGNTSYSPHKNGFYHVMEDGPIKVLIKYYKIAEPSRQIGKYSHIFEEQKDYFYWYNGDFVLISRKKQAIQALGLSNKEVRKNFKPRSLYYATDSEKYILELVKLRESMDLEFNGFEQ